MSDQPQAWRHADIMERDARIKELETRLDDWHKVADERAAEIVRLQSILGDCAMMLRRMIARAKKDWPGDPLAEQARELLARHDLQGSPLRDSSSGVERRDTIPAEPRDMTNVTGLTERERYGLDQLDAPGGPRPNKRV